MRRPITNDDRYVYLISHFGLVVDYADSWEPSKHKPLLLYIQDFIDGQIPIAGWDCIDGQRSLLLVEEQV